jgi:hypothetical protein
MATVGVLAPDFATNVKFIEYVLPLTSLHGAAVQPVTLNAWIVPDSDPQSLNGVCVHAKLIEQDKTVRMNNANMIFFSFRLKINIFERNDEYERRRKFC